jgi:EmrB/QacA subfamily drug resistance transporter
MTTSHSPRGGALVLGEAPGRWVLTATVLGSGMAFLDATVVNVALPAIGADLDADLGQLAWTVNAYTLTLAALLLLGGSLGDRFGRRAVFCLGVGWFAAASLLCGVAPNAETLIAARALQGVGAALLTPGSLALLQASFRTQDRARAIGAWSGLSGVAGAVGPLAGGWLIEAASWRWIFLVNLPVAVAVAMISLRHVPESHDPSAPRHVDLLGVTLAAVGLAALTYGLIAWPEAGVTAPHVVLALGAGVAGLTGFVVWERAAAAPMLPLSIFRLRLFSAANVVTFAVYAALGGVFFWLVLALQVIAGFSPLRAGLALVPTTVLLLLLSARAGAVAQRFGPRAPMTAGPLLAAAGAAFLTRIPEDASYVRDVLPWVSVLGLGLAITVAPLTAAVLAAVPDRHAGLASGVNNAVARVAGLLAVAALPLVADLHGNAYSDPAELAPGYRAAMWVCAGLMATGGLLAAAFIRKPEHVSSPRLSTAVSAVPSPNSQEAPWHPDR